MFTHTILLKVTHCFLINIYHHTHWEINRIKHNISRSNKNMLLIIHIYKLEERPGFYKLQASVEEN